MTEYTEEQFAELFNKFSYETHKAAEEHGWFQEGTFNVGEKLALVHSEVSEALEEFRRGNQEESDKIEGFSRAEEELADVIIRVMDLAHHLSFRLGEAIVMKHRYNKNRPFKHGGKLF